MAIGKNKKKKLKRAAGESAQQIVDQFNVGISRSINELNNHYNALAEAMRRMTTHGLTFIDEVAPYISGEFNPR